MENRGEEARLGPSFTLRFVDPMNPMRLLGGSTVGFSPKVLLFSTLIHPPGVEFRPISTNVRWTEDEFRANTHPPPVIHPDFRAGFLQVRFVSFVYAHS